MVKQDMDNFNGVGLVGLGSGLVGLGSGSMVQIQVIVSVGLRL